MLAQVPSGNSNWLNAGREIFPAMLAAIATAQEAVCLETYTWSAGSLAERFRQALLAARQRGARVRVLVDALGSGRGDPQLRAIQRAARPRAQDL